MCCTVCYQHIIDKNVAFLLCMCLFLLAVIHDLKTFYLFLYNLFQWIGFSYIFITVMYRYLFYGIGAFSMPCLLLLYFMYFIQHVYCLVWHDLQYIGHWISNLEVMHQSYAPPLPSDRRHRSMVVIVIVWRVRVVHVLVMSAVRIRLSVFNWLWKLSVTEKGSTLHP